MLHICGVCEQEFESEEAYLDHECPNSGVTPKDPEHSMGENFQEIQEEALKRGAERAAQQ